MQENLIRKMLSNNSEKVDDLFSKCYIEFVIGNTITVFMKSYINREKRRLKWQI